MKKTPKSNRSHRSSWMKKNLSANRKTTTFHMESLEPRQMLSGISFATVNLNGDTVDSDHFQVTLTDQNGSSGQSYVTMNIISSSGKVIDPSQIQVESATPLRTTTDAHTKVTSILYQMGLGTDYSVTVTGLAEGESLKVLFTLPGDKDGNGISTQEYYEAYGEVLKGNGINAQFVKAYKNKYGVDLTENHMDTLWDLNRDGRFSTEEFERLFSSTNTMDLQQNITTNPDILNLEVNGETPREDGLVAGDQLELSGKLSEMDDENPVMAQVTVGEETRTVNLTEMADASGNFTWDIADTLGETIPEGEAVKIVLYGGKCDTKVDDPSANSWSFTLDATAPAITVTDLLTVNGKGPFEGEFYGRYDGNGNLNFELQFETDLEEAAFLAELLDEQDGIYIDVVITDAKGKAIFTATNYRLTEKNLTKKANENAYVLGLSLSQKDTKLTDGEYTLTVTPHDLTGNTVAETSATLVIDSTAPQAADVTTNYDDWGMPEGVEADYYTDGTFSGESEEVTVGFADGEKGTIYYTLDGGENWLSSGDTPVEKLTLSPQWQTGTNTIQYYLVDLAGNTLGSETEPLTWTCLLNQAPELSETGEALKTDGLTQLAKDGVTEVTVTLADQFVNDDGGILTYEGIVSSNERVTVTNDNGVLKFTFAALEDEEISYSTDISVVAKDAYGETCELVFTLEYTIDNEAPKAVNVQIIDDEGVRVDSEGWNKTEYDLALADPGSATELWLTGTMEDTSKMESFTIVWAGTTYTVDNPGADFTSTDGKFVYTASNKSFRIDILGIAAGEYVLSVYGEDEYGNVTTAENAQEITVLCDFTAPAATLGEITIGGKTAVAGETLYVNESKPNVTVNVTGADDDTWVQVWQQEGDETICLGSGQVVNGTVSITTDFPLADGLHTLLIQIVDGVENEGASQAVSLIVDMTLPVIAWNSADFGTQEGVPYTTDADKLVQLTATDSSANGGAWTITRNGIEIDYSADGLGLELGENEFTATFTDAAGNVSETLSFTVILNDIPMATESERADSVQDNGETGAYRKEYDLSGWFENTGGTLNYAVTGGAEGITATISGDTLSIDFSAWEGNRDQYGDYTFTITATDSYHETATADLVITYTNDNLPPQLTNVLVNGADTKDWNGETLFVVSTTTDLSISATVNEPSGVTELYLAVLHNGNVIEGLGQIDLRTLTGSQVTYNAETGALSIANLAEFLGTNLSEGTYTLVLFGTDELGNSSVSEETFGENASRVDILVDATAPAVTLGLSADKLLTNNTQPVITPTVTFAESYSESKGILIQIWAEMGEQRILYADGFSADGTMPELDYKTTLADGTWIFTVQAVDVAGNVTSGESSVSVTIDTVAPPAATTGLTEKHHDGDYTESETVHFSCEDAKAVITVNGEAYDSENGWTLTYGKNELNVVTTDLAGNSTETSFIIYYNDAVPTRTTEVLGTQIATFENGTVTLTIPKSEIEKLFTQTDGTADIQMYSFMYSAGCSLSVDSEDNENYVLTGTGVAEGATNLGFITVQAKDEYWKTADYIFTVYKENLAPGWDTSATLENGSLKVTIPQVFENVSYTFDVPVKDAETAVGNLVFPEGMQTCEQGTYSFAFANGKWTCTFTPTSENFTGTVNFSFSLTDVGYGLGGGEGTLLVPAKTTQMSVQLTISGVNRAPERNDAEIPTVKANAGEVVEIDLADYTRYFTDPDGDTITVSLASGGTATLESVTGQPGKYTFTPDNYGVYTFQIVASDGELSSAPVTVSIAAAGTAQITDKSLDVAIDSSIPSGVTTGDITLAEEVAIPAGSTVKSESLLTVGSTLGAETVLVATTTEQVAFFDEWVQDLPAEDYTKAAAYPGASIYLYTFLKAFTIPENLTLTGDLSIKAGTTLASGSTLKAGCNLAAVIPNVKIVDGVGVQAIYNAYIADRDNYALEHSITLSGQGMNLAGATVSFESLPENSCFRSVALVDGNLVVSYQPYLANQDRSPQTVLIKQADGVEIPILLSTEYEKPFEVIVNVVETPTISNTEDSVATSIRPATTSVESGKTYYIEVWTKYTLPIYQKSALSIYSEYAFQNAIQIVISAEDAAKLAISGNNRFSEVTPQSDGSLLLECTNIISSEISTTGVRYACGMDGEFLQAGLYTINQNDGEFAMTFTENSSSSFSFKLPGWEAGVNVTGKIHSSQYAQKVIHVTSEATPLRGTESARETVIEGTGVYMTLVKDKTESEQTQTLRESESYLTEWDSSWVELWVNTQDEGVDLKKVLVDLGYDATLFTATDLEYGSGVEGLDVLWEDGKIIGIGGDLSQAVTNEDGFVLLGRVKLESAAGNGVAADNVGAVKAGLVLENIALHQSNGELVEANTQVYVNTNIFPVVYDSNDDGRIDIDDLIVFSKLFGESSVDSTDPRVWALDFDKSGKIDIDDLIAFAKNFGVTKADVDGIIYPERFMEQWIGSMKIGTGDANVGKMLETAIRQWEEKLNEALAVDVQIIVKDLDDSEKILGQTILVGTDENGVPNTAVVYLDDDALGKGWFVSEDGLIPSEQYDLYTVLLHELGHALGFNASYTGYTDTIDTPISYTDDAGKKHYLRPDGHVEDNQDDLMYYEINPGERKEISDLDAEIVRKAREQGGVIEEQVLYAIQGTTSNEMVDVSSEVVVSSMMEASQWEAMLVSAVTEEVRKVEGAATDKAWEMMEPELLSTDNSQRASATSDNWDWLDDGNEETLESLLDEIATEPLSMKLKE